VETRRLQFGHEERQLGVVAVVDRRPDVEPRTVADRLEIEHLNPCRVGVRVVDRDHPVARRGLVDVARKNGAVDEGALRLQGLGVDRRCHQGQCEDTANDDSLHGSSQVGILAYPVHSHGE